MGKKNGKRRDRPAPRPAPPPPPAPLPAQPVGPGTAARVIVLTAQVVRLAFWLAVVAIVVTGIPPILAAVAGTETVFDFNFTAGASVSISVMTSGAAVGLYLRNRQLTRRLQESEGRNPPSSPQAQLPLPGDGGAQ